MDNFQGNAKNWDTNCFGNIFRKKRWLMSHIEGIDCKLGDGNDRGLEKHRAKLWQEYQEILLQEDAFWYQRARQDWIRFGDRNTKYFHTSTVIRKKKNVNVVLEDDEGNRVDDPSVLRVCLGVLEGRGRE